MQNPITIEKKIFSIKTLKEFQGEIVPFEVDTFQKDFENSQRGGLFDLSNWGIIEIHGVDAAEYLHRMSTANIKTLSPGSCSPGAFLTGKGTVISIGVIVRLAPDRFFFVVSPNQTSNVLAHLELFHFQEKLEIQDRTQELALLGLWNTRNDAVRILWSELRNPSLSFSILERPRLEQQVQDLKNSGLPLLGMHLFHYFRVEMGLPWMGWELQESDLILEAGLEDFVARNKGCYPGQEVVERIFTYGQVNRKLLKVQISGLLTEEQTLLPQELKTLRGDSVGKMMSGIISPKGKTEGLGLAYVRKAFWSIEGPVKTENGLSVSWDFSLTEASSV